MNVWHAASHRIGQIICGTSNHADGSPRVIVQWQDGTESKVTETELRSAVWVHWPRSRVGSWL